MAVAAVLLLVALAPAEAGRPPPPGLPRFADAMNRSDPAAAVALFAPGGSYQGVLVCDPEACVGRAAVGEGLRREAEDGTRHLLLASDRGELRCDSLAPLADRVVYRAEIDEGADGIASLVLRPDSDDAQTARVLAGSARVRAWLDDWAAGGGDGPLTLPVPAW